MPRLFAAIAIIEDPEKYGMTLPGPDEPGERRRHRHRGAGGQAGAARRAPRARAGTLADLNPELRYKGTPKRRVRAAGPGRPEPKLVAGIDSIPEWKPPQTQYVVHRVGRGQTLSVIARRYGTSVSAIMRTNNLRSANRIREGQRLRIPVAGAGSVRRVSRTAVDGVHTVRRGDTLGAIARAYGTTVSRLKSDNRLSSNTIHPGQELRVGAASSGPTVASAGGGTYRVRRGDTLGKIADRHGVGAVRADAGQRPREVGAPSTPGQELVIPR